MNLLSDALLITVIGMGLVFVALLLLWGLMELMMRVTAKSAEAEANEAQEEGEAEEEAAPAESVEQPMLKQQAAAVAVAVALAMKPKSNGKIILPTAETASAWQAVQRAGFLNKRSAMYSRKQRGSVR